MKETIKIEEIHEIYKQCKKITESKSWFFGKNKSIKLIISSQNDQEKRRHQWQIPDFTKGASVQDSTNIKRVIKQ